MIDAPTLPATIPSWDELEELAERLIPALAERGLTVATAESCTGGLISGVLTAISGSSAVVDRGLVTYSNQAKQDLLGVKDETLARHGAVSAEVAAEMASGALANARTDIAVSVTGIAGPGGGSEEKPVGTVHFGLAVKDQETCTFHMVFEKLDRKGVRYSTVLYALLIISNLIKLPKETSRALP